MEPSTPFDLTFAFRGRDLVVVEQDGALLVPGPADWAELAEDAVLPAGTVALGLRRLWQRLDEADFRRAGRAVQIIEWDRSHQFCGRCGERTERVASENTRRCPRCRVSPYPRISPAIIVLVTRGDAALLGCSARFPMRMYSTLAGFVEAGETLEETVAREVREEAGIEVRDVRYFGSQPWPFPDSLMIGFTAEHAGGEARPDPAELVDVGWFTVDALPPVPPRLSIARALIDAWVRRMGGDPDALETAG